MRWTIAILTIPEREGDLLRILSILNYQIDQYGVADDVQILVAGMPGGIGGKRQWCLDNATGEYFNFIDDDDLVAHNYISSIYPLLDGVDYVGFRMQHLLNGKRSKPTFHSLRYSEWSDDAKGYYRNVSHLNPIRTELARDGRFDRDFGEDHAWSKQVNPETEHYISEPMYFYFDSPRHSASRALQRG